MMHNLKDSRILVVDDQVANLDMISGFLELEEYSNVMTTTDSRQVIPLLDSFHPDIILLDLMMPYLSGYEVLELIHVVLPKEEFLPILVLTADITSEAKRKALTLGASDFLTKPFDLTEVGLRIRNLLLTRSLMNQILDQNKILDEKVKQRTAELKQMNEDLIKARDKALASDKLKTVFMQNISHEVRTPLNGILGFSKLAAESNIDPEEKKVFLQFLDISANRLMDTITDYMDISLLTTGSLKVSCTLVPIDELLKQIRTRFEPLCATKNLVLNFEIDEDLHDKKLISDAEILHKILTHLLDNAVKFTNEGSVTVRFRIKGEKFEIKVCDTGQGISDEARKRIFEPFMQEDIDTSRRHEGSGLGLTLVKGFLEVLGGEIRFDSETGVGSEFTVILPLDSKSEMMMTTPALTVRLSEQVPVLLIAEDDDTNRFFLEMVLKKMVIKIMFAKDGLETIELCKNHPEIQLVLMDIRMPVMDGIEATRQIKSLRKDLPIIAVTAYAMSSDEHRIREAGFDDFIPKPVSAEMLRQKMAKFGIAYEK